MTTRPARVGYFFTVLFPMSCHHSGRWYCVENRFKRPRAHEACWLMDDLGWNGLFGRLGLVAQPGEGIVVHMGRCCFCFSKQLRHDLPARICRQWRHIDKSLLCISARKRHGHITRAVANGMEFWAWRLVSGRLVGHHLDGRTSRQASRDDVQMLDRACRLCILHRAIADNDKCPTASWILSNYMSSGTVKLLCS